MYKETTGNLRRINSTKGRKARQTMVTNNLEREISCSPWEGLACPHDGFFFFPFGGWVGRIFLFFTPFFPICSPQVLKRFPSVPNNN